METSKKHIKVDSSIINFLKRESEKKKQRHQEYVDKFKHKEFITN